MKPEQVYIPFIQTIVNEVIFQSKPLDKSFEKSYKQIGGLSLADKSFLFHKATSIVRYWILLFEIYKKISGKQNINIHKILEIQTLLESVTGNAGKKMNLSGDAFAMAHGEFMKIPHIRESYPLWLYNACLAEIGEGWEEIAHALNQDASVILRANPIKTNAGQLLHLLKNSGKRVSALNDYPEAVRVDSFFDLFRNEYYQQGFYEVQDASSQRISPFLEVMPGMRVIDACAGNGGKTLHLAGLMQNKGRLIALDIAAYKLEVLRKRLKRAGIFNVEARHIESSKTIKRLHGTADRLLLDVPCSGTGVLKRNPDIKYHLAPEKLETLKATQEEILDKYSLMLNKNGIMVYSTCSIFPSENQQQVFRFLNRMQGSFELLEQQSISPLNGYDGFYMAKIKRIL